MRQKKKYVQRSKGSMHTKRTHIHPAQPKQLNLIKQSEPRLYYLPTLKRTNKLIVYNPQVLRSELLPSTVRKVLGSRFTLLTVQVTNFSSSLFLRKML